ncbi:tumor necrosis factor receptor superfamily member 5 [Rhynchocyon petersi]
MVRLPLWCLLWGCLLTSVHPEPPTPCRQDQYYVNNQCCDLCQADLGLKIQKKGTVSTDTICTCEEDKHCTTDACESCTPHKACHPGFGVHQRGPLPRLRVLVAIPIIVGVLFVVLLVFIFISKSSGRMVKKPNNKDPPGQDAKKSPEETVFIGYITANTTAPVQETLQGCQPVAQEDGKESRISVQERL